MQAENNLRARMQKLVAEIMEMEVSEIKPESRLREDLGMDSLGSLELLSTIGDELGLHLDVDDAMDIVTFHDACEFVEAAIVRRGSAPVASRVAPLIAKT